MAIKCTVSNLKRIWPETVCICSKQKETDVYLRQVHLGDEHCLRLTLGGSKQPALRMFLLLFLCTIAYTFNCRLQLCSCSASERTAARETARAWEIQLFSVSLPINAFISTWKMRDYFPTPTPRAPLMGTLMRSSRNVQPFSSSKALTPRRAQTFGNPQLADKKKKKEGAGVWEVYAPPCAVLHLNVTLSFVTFLLNKPCHDCDILYDDWWYFTAVVENNINNVQSQCPILSLFWPLHINEERDFDSLKVENWPHL